MELYDYEGGYLVQENSNIFVKESRATRKEKIERNKAFHRKNPKSVAYYQNLAGQDNVNNDKDNKQPINMDNIMDESEAILSHDSGLVKENGFVSLNSTKNSHRNSHQSYKKQQKPNKTSQEQGISAKLKTTIQLMFQNISKHYKREGIFFDNSHGYDTIVIMKDFNVQTQIGKTKTNLTLRAIVGQYPNLKEIVSQHGTHFSPLKKDFHEWWTKIIQQYDAKEQLDNVINKMWEEYSQDKRITKFLPSLENKLIQVLKKPTKQPHGFLKKIEQVEANWSEEAHEIVHIEAIENALRFSSYEESFPLARSLKRKFSIFVGPTNSGKTYAALNELSQARTGSYLGPLRLMAHEGREALFERGIVANLVTGEERMEMPGATHVSSTVEMCGMGKIIDVAVIDEIQMIADSSRGWAWSQALIGVPAKHVVLVGSEEALPFILPVLENLGEEYEIKRFERKNALHIHEPIWKFKDLKEGDCVVVFSRKSALEMKNAIESSGKRCSVIYGNLSPEVRRSEANKFKSGENPILVATDAIGMGLNLPINRLFFSTLEKFDGIETRLLNISEIKQIAGRSGRFGFATHGEVGILFDDNSHWRTLLHKAIYAGYEKAEDVRISIAPNLKQIQTICDTLGKQDLYSALIFFKEKMIRDHKLYKTANLDAMIEIASLIKNKNLDLATGLNYACVPIDTGSDTHVKHFFRWMNNHINERQNNAPSLPEVVTDQKNDSYSLYEAENYVKLCMAYRWLHYKYPETYHQLDEVSRNAKVTNEYIEHALHKHIVISKNPRWRR